MATTNDTHIRVIRRANLEALYVAIKTLATHDLVFEDGAPTTTAAVYALLAKYLRDECGATHEAAEGFMRELFDACLKREDAA